MSNNPVTLVGKKFYNITITELTEVGKYSRRKYSGVCDCGKEITVEGNDVRYGRIRDCGCNFGEESLVGKRFERCLVTGALSSLDGQRATRYIVKCDCGGVFNTVGSNLTLGRVRSCGCINKSLPRSSAVGADLSNYRSIVRNKLTGLFLTAMLKKEGKDLYQTKIEDSRCFDILKGFAEMNSREASIAFNLIKGYTFQDLVSIVETYIPTIEDEVLAKAGDCHLTCEELVDTILNNLINA